MTPSLSTQFHRAVFALPLLALALAVALGAGSPTTTVIVIDELPPAAGAASTLPGDDLASIGLVAKLDCDAAVRPAGTRGLARMPGDIGPLAGRLRCAQ